MSRRVGGAHIVQESYKALQNSTRQKTDMITGPTRMGCHRIKFRRTGDLVLGICATMPQIIFLI